MAGASVGLVARMMRVGEVSDDPKVLAPSVVTDTGAGAKLSAWNIGLAKKEHWRFEEEWRYRIHLRPEGTESGYTVSDCGDRGSFIDIQ